MKSKALAQYDIFDYYNPMSLDHAELIAQYDYDPRFGFFYKRGESKILGGWSCDGYVSIPVFKKPYKAHRLAWFYTHGRWPLFLIDHKNRHRFDNRIKNLRDVPQSVNAVKRPAVSDKRGPFNPKGKEHYIWMTELVVKEQHNLSFFDNLSD